MKKIFDKIKEGYNEIIDNVEKWSLNTHILLHGYDYAIPREGGKWLGEPFSALGFNLSTSLPEKIIVHLVDKFYTLLGQIKGKHNTVHVINVRGQVKNNWNDELHPNETASKKIADLFIDKMEEIKSSSVPVS